MQSYFIGCLRSIHESQLHSPQQALGHVVICQAWIQQSDDRRDWCIAEPWLIRTNQLLSEKGHVVPGDDKPRKVVCSITV